MATTTNNSISEKAPEAPARSDVQGLQPLREEAMRAGVGWMRLMKSIPAKHVILVET